MKILDKFIECWHDAFAVVYLKIDRGFAKKLETRNGKKEMAEYDLRQIVNIHNKVFPKSFDVYDNLEFNEFLCKFCCFSSAQINWKVLGNSYIIWTEHFDRIELNELASDGDFGFEMVFFLIKQLSKIKNKKIHSLIRQSTAYPLIKKFEEQNRIIILKDIKKNVDGEEIHDVVFRSR